MKIKITNPVIIGGRILKKDSAHDVDRKTAESLIKGDYAVEQIESQQQQQQQQRPPATREAFTRESLLADYGTASKSQLLQAKGEIEKAILGNPEYPGAKLALEVMEELLKKAN